MPIEFNDTHALLNEILETCKALKQEKGQLGSCRSNHHSHSVALWVLGLKAVRAHNASQATPHPLGAVHREHARD